VETASTFIGVSATELELRLAAALLVAGKNRSVERALFWQCITLRDEPASAPPEFQELLRFLKDSVQLQEFTFPVVGFSRGHVFLVQWLIARAQQTDSKGAIEDFNRYLATIEMPMSAKLWFSGFEIPSSHFDSEISVVAWSDSPVDDTKWTIASKVAEMVSGFVCLQYSIKPFQSRFPVPNPSFDRLYDVLRSCAVVANAGWKLEYLTIDAPEWAAYPAQVISLDDRNPRPFLHPSIEEKMPQIKALWQQLSTVSSEDQVRFRRHIDRLNRSIASTHYNQVDSAIDLGIALESALGPIGRDQRIASYLKVRAAEMTDGTSSAKKSAGDVANELYDMRSRAVHAGYFEEQTKWADYQVAQQMLTKGQLLVGSLLAKLIQTNVGS
jgi:hypothetical protein